MKINYYNENYENNVYTIIIIILLIVVITIWGIINKLTSNIGILILCTTSNIMLLIPLIIGIKQYKRKKKKKKRTKKFKFIYYKKWNLYSRKNCFNL